MLNFKDALAVVKTVSKNIEESTDNEKRLEAEWMKGADLVSRVQIKKTLEDEWADACASTQYWKIFLQMAKHNAKIALFNDVAPVVVELLEKYKGKPYGEKTREKFAAELAEKTGARGYIGSKYGTDEINVWPVDTFGNTYSITIGTVYDQEKKANTRMLVDNKLQPVPLDRLQVWYIKKEYIDDIPGAIEALQEAHKKAVEKQKELSCVCSKFNEYAVEGIENIYQDKRISERIIV